MSPFFRTENLKSKKYLHWTTLKKIIFQKNMSVLFRISFFKHLLLKFINTPIKFSQTLLASRLKPPRLGINSSTPWTAFSQTTSLMAWTSLGNFPQWRLRKTAAPLENFGMVWKKPLAMASSRTKKNRSIETVSQFLYANLEISSRPITNYSLSPFCPRSTQAVIILSCYLRKSSLK